MIPAARDMLGPVQNWTQPAFVCGWGGADLQREKKRWGEKKSVWALKGAAAQGRGEWAARSGASEVTPKLSPLQGKTGHGTGRRRRKAVPTEHGEFATPPSGLVLKPKRACGEQSPCPSSALQQNPWDLGVSPATHTPEPASPRSISKVSPDVGSGGRSSSGLWPGQEGVCRQPGRSGREKISARGYCPLLLHFSPPFSQL